MSQLNPGYHGKPTTKKWKKEKTEKVETNMLRTNSPNGESVESGLKKKRNFLEGCGGKDLLKRNYFGMLYMRLLSLPREYADQGL